MNKGLLIFLIILAYIIIGFLCAMGAAVINKKYPDQEYIPDGVDYSVAYICLWWFILICSLSLFIITMQYRVLKWFKDNIE